MEWRAVQLWLCADLQNWKINKQLRPRFGAPQILDTTVSICGHQFMVTKDPQGVICAGDRFSQRDWFDLHKRSLITWKSSGDHWEAGAKTERNLSSEGWIGEHTIECDYTERAIRSNNKCPEIGEAAEVWSDSRTSSKFVKEHRELFISRLFVGRLAGKLWAQAERKWIADNR